MDKNFNIKQQLINNIDDCLKNQLEKLEFERKSIAFYREYYFGLVHHVRNRFYGIMGFIATILIAAIGITLGKGIDQILYSLIIILIIVSSSTLIVSVFFYDYLPDEGNKWIKIEDAYNKAISNMNNHRIFLTAKAFNSEEINIEQLSIFGSYVKICLGLYLIQITKASKNAHSWDYVPKVPVFRSILSIGAPLIRKSFNKISYAKEILKSLPEQQNSIIDDARKEYELKREEFNKNEFLPSWPSYCEMESKKNCFTFSF